MIIDDGRIIDGKKNKENSMCVWEMNNVMMVVVVVDSRKSRSIR